MGVEPLWDDFRHHIEMVLDLGQADFGFLAACTVEFERHCLITVGTLVQELVCLLGCFEVEAPC